jgi:transposase
VTLDELEAILARAARGPLGEDDRETLRATFRTLFAVTDALERKGASVRRLRKLLFGSGSEKLDVVLGALGSDEGAKAEPDAGPASEGGGPAAAAKPPKRPAKGHGRNGASAYRGAAKVKVAHESLSAGQPCPSCAKGKVYGSVPPQPIVRIRGQAPLAATVYELKRLRCNLCGEVFTARPPPGVGEAKYDATAAAMIALLKYGSGLPFHRLEGLQKGLGIPLPSATQWEIVRESAEGLEPVYRELVRQAAQGEVVHNDDTPMKILERMGQRRAKALAQGAKPDAAGKAVSTSGILSRVGERDVALFFTGPETAGGHLEQVLAERQAELEAPIQMSDALSHNATDEARTIVAHCLAHGRRRFVDVAASFPAECRFVLEVLRDVYQVEARARQEGLSPEARLRRHQEASAPRMEALAEWMREQVEGRWVEPNSGLGEAIAYLQKHWEPLTLFLRVPGAPLDNNAVERALKKVILHRKNSLFFKTDRGARVGDLYLSLIYTAELAGVSPFDYLVALQRHAAAAAACPAAWMPWSYEQARAALEAPEPPTTPPAR